MKRHVITASVGDWNLGESAVRAIAKRAGGIYLHNWGPDGAIVSGTESSMVQKLPKYGSDHHHAGLYTLRAPGGDVARIIGWNPYAGQKPAEVREGLLTMIERHRQPDVFVLQEAYRLRKMLTTIPGYRRHQGLNQGEGADCAILIRRDHAVVNDGTLVMRQEWTRLANGRRREPRQYPFDRIQLAHKNLTLRVLDVHFPTGGYGTANSRAVEESADRVVRWHDTRREVK